MIETKPPREKVVVVGTVRPGNPRTTVEETVSELASLARSVGADVQSTVIQQLKRIDSAFFIGTGKAKEIAAMINGTGASTVIFDDDLTPGQSKNLEKVLNKKVIDRTGLILEIFAGNARTREAKTQVELAQLQYFLPRLTRQWTHLERQVGGIGVRGGMGEKQLEIDRRLVRKKIKKLTSDLETIEKQRQVRSGRRDNMFNVTLIGYTNVGKSTLFNQLTDAGVLVEDKLFATLDSTIRKIELSAKQEILLADTVGFIRKLPHNLVASFRSTLGVVRDADLLIHVVDVSNPLFEEQIEAVENVLEELKVENKDTLMVFNKVDLAENRNLLEEAKQSYPAGVFVSAEKGIGISQLLEAVKTAIAANYLVEDYRIPIEDSRTIAYIHDLGHVLKQTFNGKKTHLKVRISKENASKIGSLIENSLTPVE